MSYNLTVTSIHRRGCEGSSTRIHDVQNKNSDSSPRLFIRKLKPLIVKPFLPPEHGNLRHAYFPFNLTSRRAGVDLQQDSEECPDGDTSGEAF